MQHYITGIRPKQLIEQFKKKTKKSQRTIVYYSPAGDSFLKYSWKSIREEADATFQEEWQNSAHLCCAAAVSHILWWKCFPLQLEDNTGEKIYAVFILNLVRYHTSSSFFKALQDKLISVFLKKKKKKKEQQRTVFKEEQFQVQIWTDVKVE